MPNYEYECESCGIRFERMQHFKDAPLKQCPECGGCVHRVLQPVGIIFKGSGFYVTDHRQSSNGADRPPKTGEPAKESEEKKAAESPRSEAEGAAERPRSEAEGAAERPRSEAQGAAERPRSEAEGAAPTAEKRTEVKSAKKGAAA